MGTSAYSINASFPDEYKHQEYFLITFIHFTQIASFVIQGDPGGLPRRRKQDHRVGPSGAAGTGGLSPRDRDPGSGCHSEQRQVQIQ